MQTALPPTAQFAFAGEIYVIHTHSNSMSIENIKILAALSSIIGSAILAYRVTGILSALSLVANCHEVNIQQLMPSHRGDIHNLGNSTTHVEKAQKKFLLTTGFLFIIASGVLQLIALVLPSA
jgi:hypothetical protein